jgi:O-antigen/teichoic acid export membrane protein
MVTFGQEGLRWWLDPDFARFSTPVLPILAIGVFINSLAQVFATLIQGVGRPDVTAALHLVELPIYLPMLWWAVQRFGIVGTAMVWMGRVFVDAVMLFWFSRRFVGGNGILIALSALLIPLTIAETAPRAAVVAMMLAVFAPVGWLVMLNGNERTSIKPRLRPAVTS